MSGRLGNSIRNIIYRIGAQVATILLKFVSRTVFIHVLSVAYLGINGLFSEILQVLSLADLGFTTAMVFSMYQPLAEHDEEKLAQLVQFYKKIYMGIAAAITLIGLALIPFLPYLVNLEQDMPYLRIYYVLYLANTVSSYLCVYRTCILSADQKYYLISKYNTIFNVLSIISSSVFLIVTRKFMVYLIIQVLFTYLNNFYLSHLTVKLYPFLKKKVKPLAPAEGKGIFTNVKAAFIYKLANTLVSSTDNTLISVIVGTVTVGLYSNYSMVVSNITMIINMIFSSVTASLGNLVVEKNEEKNYQVYNTMQYVSFLLSSVAAAGVLVMMNDFITVWLGEEYLLDRIVVLAIVINMYFSVVLMPIWSYREATGMYRQTKYVMVCTAAVNLVMSILLGNWIGLAGILFATSIARISTYFWYEPRLLFARFFGKKVGDYYRGIGKNIMVTGAVAAMGYICFSKWTVVSWGGFFVKFLAVALSCFLITLIFYCKNPEFEMVRGIARSLVTVTEGQVMRTMKKLDEKIRGGHK